MMLFIIKHYDYRTFFLTLCESATEVNLSVVQYGISITAEYCFEVNQNFSLFTEPGLYIFSIRKDIKRESFHGQAQPYGSITYT